jgi:sugar O-acyltransferase (sialic acid O-acetyltransferase NeuD family)
VAQQRLLIFPCNGNGREALDAMGEDIQLVGFVDDTVEKQGAGPHGLPVMARTAFADFPDARVLAVPGGPASYLRRRAIVEDLAIAADRFATVIHPAARVSRYATIGYNVLIMAGVVITSNAVIGNHVCILPNSVIHHDAVIGDWTLIGGNVTIAGGCRIGLNCYIGSGSSIIHDARVGDHSLVGLGANVIASVPAGVKVAGNPARRIGAAAR